MFNVTRSEPAPKSIVNGTNNHNQPDILEALKTMFHSKCYICEIKDPTAVAVEHFDATNTNRTDWDNLYYACHRCNSNFKNQYYNNLIDPADPTMDVSRAIRHKFPITPNSDVEISINNALAATPSLLETAELIDKVFNDASTGNRKVSREALRKKLFSVLKKVLKQIFIYTDEDSLPAEKDDARERIIHFLRVEQEFSAFVRWLVLEDETLKAQFEQFISDEVTHSDYV